MIKRVMLFAYDGTGLGHLMRLIKIASGFSEDVKTLVVSGHNALPEIVPSNIAFIKLPNFYDERDKGKTNIDVNTMRIKILWNIITDFKPDAFITDYLPLGKRCELYPIITKFPTKKYFILRSEIGGDSLMYNDVFSKRNLMFLERDYDKIYIASDKKIQEEGIYDWLPQSVQKKMQYAGCVTYKVSEENVNSTRLQYDTIDKKWIVCSVGGGKRGSDYIKACLDIALKNENLDIVFDIVLGHYSTLTESSLSEMIKGKTNIRIHNSIKDLYLLNASADIVVCSGAYNSLVEAMQGKEKIIIAKSVMNDEEENEQTNNIIRLSSFYDIRRISETSELESVFNNAIKSKPIKKALGLNMNGIEFITKEIENQQYR